MLERSPRVLIPELFTPRWPNSTPLPVVSSAAAAVAAVGGQLRRRIRETLLSPPEVRLGLRPRARRRLALVLEAGWLRRLGRVRPRRAPPSHVAVAGATQTLLVSLVNRLNIGLGSLKSITFLPRVRTRAGRASASRGGRRPPRRRGSRGGEPDRRRTRPDDGLEAGRQRLFRLAAANMLPVAAAAAAVSPISLVLLVVRVGGQRDGGRGRCGRAHAPVAVRCSWRHGAVAGCCCLLPTRDADVKNSSL